MNIYEERPWWLILSALLAVATLVAYFLLPSCPINVRFDESPLSRGEYHFIWVTVRNPMDFPAKDVLIYIQPRSEGIRLEEQLYTIPEMYPGDEKTVRVPFFVPEEALPGTHTLEVFVAFPGKTWKEVVRVRVE